MKIIQHSMPILIPEEGYFLTNGELYSDMVFLGCKDSPSNWHDILIEEVPENERILIENNLFNHGIV